MNNEAKFGLMVREGAKVINCVNNSADLLLLWYFLNAIQVSQGPSYFN